LTSFCRNRNKNHSPKANLCNNKLP